MIQDFLDEFTRYKLTAEKAMAQVSEDALNHVPAPEMNSIAMIVRHLSGNLRSRFTDFLTSDGEKPWRDREAEFAERRFSRDELTAMWEEGWRVALTEIGALSDADLARNVVIRGVPLSVHAALARSTAHAAAHVGQIVLLARMHAGHAWISPSIPRGGTQAYNQSPMREKRPT